MNEFVFQPNITEAPAGKAWVLVRSLDYSRSLYTLNAKPLDYHEHVVTSRNCVLACLWKVCVVNYSGSKIRKYSAIMYWGEYVLSSGWGGYCKREVMVRPSLALPCALKLM